MRKHITGKIEELKSTRSSWKIILLLGLYYEHDEDDKKFEAEIFIQSICEKVILEIDSYVSVGDIIKSIEKEI